MADFDKYIRQGEPDRHIEWHYHRQSQTDSTGKSMGKSGKWVVKNMNLNR